LQNHKIIQVGRHLGGLWSHLWPKAGSALRFSCEILCSFVELGLESVQQWKLHNLPEQPALAFDYSSSCKTGAPSIKAHRFGGSSPESYFDSLHFLKNCDVLLALQSGVETPPDNPDAHRLPALRKLQNSNKRSFGALVTDLEKNSLQFKTVLYFTIIHGYDVVGSKLSLKPAIY